MQELMQLIGEYGDQMENVGYFSEGRNQDIAKQKAKILLTTITSKLQEYTNVRTQSLDRPVPGS